MRRKLQRGFSLLELMIVLMIVVTLSAMAIPSYLRARQAAYEASAVGFAHSVQADQAAYKATHNTYATSFRQLPGYASAAADQSSGSSGATSGSSSGDSGGGPITPSAADIASGFGMTTPAGGSASTVIRNAYAFTMLTPNADQWYMTAFPLDDRLNGLYVYADSAGELKSQKGGPPQITDMLHAQ